MNLTYLIPIALILLFVLIHLLIKTTRFILKIALFLAIAAIIYVIFFA